MSRKTPELSPADLRAITRQALRKRKAEEDRKHKERLKQLLAVKKQLIDRCRTEMRKAADAGLLSVTVTLHNNERNEDLLRAVKEHFKKFYVSYNPNYKDMIGISWSDNND